MRWVVTSLLALTLYSVALDRAWAEEKTSYTPNDVYTKVLHMNEGLSVFIRGNLGQQLNWRPKPELLANELQPRHVFQKALTVERKLTALMRIYGLKVHQTSIVQVQNYSPQQVYKLLDGLNKNVMRLIGGEDRKSRVQIATNKKPRDVYGLLDRMDKFLVRMGAPVTQPFHVLQRMKALVKVASTLCRPEQCAQIKRAVLSSHEVRTPLHVYEEVYRLIDEIDGYTKQYDVNIDGGVYAPEIEKALITPSHVNSVVEIAFADLVAIANQQGYEFAITLPPVYGFALPRDVWVEANFARRLLQAANRR